MKRKKLQKRLETIFVKEFKKDEVVAVTTFQDKLVIATKSGVYFYPKESTIGVN